MGKKIIVTGSYNASIFIKGERIPGIGETCMGDTYFTAAGGKGSNQAVAAKLQGADISFIGKLGKDGYAQEALKMYEDLGIDREHISQDGSTHTGIAVIFVDEKGNNSIMVASGANLNLKADEIVSSIEKEGDVFIAGFQLENDVNEICEALKKLHAMGVRTLLDPAPAVPLPEDVYPAISIIKPNEHEASILSGISVRTPEDAEKAGKWFLDKGVEVALITLGEKGSQLVTKDESVLIPAPVVKAVDTTGAGDTFSGSFMAALSQGKSYQDAIRYASCAAALSVTKMGVVEAIPTAEETQAFLKETYGK